MIVKYFTGVHVFDVCLHLVLVAGRNINGCAYFLLSVELEGVGCDVGSEIPFNPERSKCLFSFKSGDDAPFVAEVFEDCLDGLIGVADVIFLKLLDVVWVNDVLYQAVDSDSVDGLLFPILLLLNFVFRVEIFLVDEGGAVGDSIWGERLCVQAVVCGGAVTGDILKFLVIDDKGEASVATSPLCCFH